MLGGLIGKLIFPAVIVALASSGAVYFLHIYKSLTVCEIKNSQLESVIENLERAREISNSIDELSDAAVIERLRREFGVGIDGP